jgi:hypothetical protein
MPLSPNPHSAASRTWTPRAPARPWPAVVLLLTLLVPGCTGPRVERVGDPAIDVEYGISPTPPMTGTAPVWALVEDAGTTVGEDARVWAAFQGAGSEPGEEVLLSRQADGRWTGEVLFSSAGPGMIRFRVDLPPDRFARFRFPISVSRRPSG